MTLPLSKRNYLGNLSFKLSCGEPDSDDYTFAKVLDLQTPTSLFVSKTIFTGSVVLEVMNDTQFYYKLEIGNQKITGSQTG